MTVGLDTSVTLRLLTGEPGDQAETARAFVAAAAEPVSISDLVAGESYFALRHHYGVPHVEAVRALLGLVSDPRVMALGAARTVLADAASLSHAKSQPGLMDRLIHAAYEREGVRVVTFDRAMGRLEGVEVMG